MRDNERGYTPIFDAVIADSPENLQLLIDYGANVEVVATKGQGETPVHIAAENGYSECLRKLLNAGALNHLFLSPVLELKGVWETYVSLFGIASPHECL